MKIFIGSSTEKRDYMQTVALWIEDDGHQPVPWDDPTSFPPGEHVFSRLLAISREVDAAVFIFAEDDQIWYRQDALTQPRDNVLLEYGLFSGALGQHAAIICKVGTPKIPTDTHGIVVVDISPGNQARARMAFKAWLHKLDEQQKVAPHPPQGDWAADVKVFRAPTEEKYNQRFYDYFRKVISSARQDIYITGEGFECADEEGRVLARSFIDAFREALSRGVRVVRIQTRLKTNSEWACLLGDLLKAYPDNFQLYVLKKEKVSQMSSVCVIDPEHGSANIVEIMLSTQRLFGTTAADLAGTAVFIEGQQILARDLRGRILSLKEPQVSVPLVEPDDVNTSLCGEEFYFAYGSNMLEGQMKDRCESAIRVAVGVLRDHKLVFNRKGSYRAGGVASIERADGDRVYGVIWKIHSSEFWELDEKEDPRAYTREKIAVSAENGVAYSCHVYVAIPQDGSFTPDEGYLNIMLEGAREADLPDDYIKHLRSFGS